MNVYDKSYELARAIRECDENREYRKIKSNVFLNEKNREQIMDFKQKQFEIQAEQLTGKEPEKTKIEELQKLYGILIANPEINKYFESEFRYERLISDVYKILGEAIDIDTEMLK